MPILRAVCPECDAGMKCTDPAGFTPGEKITCPRCGTRFTIGAAAQSAPRRKQPVKAAVTDEEDEDDRPRKKRKNATEREGSYKNSPVRFIVLGVLVVIMLVLAFFLYQKWQREKEASAGPTEARQVG